MYSLASKLKGLPIISLQTGEPVAFVHHAIIEPANLEAIALRCESPHHRELLVLMCRDIRQFASDCVIVDNEDELSEPDDIIRLQEVIKANFTPLEKRVVTESGRKLGHVEDYTLNLETSRIQKLYIHQSLLRAWMGANLTVDRTQIIDVTPDRIIVKDTTVPAPVLQPDSIPEPHP